MRHKTMVFALTVILAACNTDSVLIPEMSPDACVVTVGLAPREGTGFEIPTYFGTNEVSEESYNLGQEPLDEGWYGPERSVVINRGEFAHLVIGNMGGGGITALGNGTSPKYYYISSWGDGSSSTRTYFDILRFERSAPNITLERVALKKAEKQPGERIPISLPDDTRYTYFVLPKELVNFGCEKDVSYTFSAPAGVTAFIENSLEEYNNTVFLMHARPVKVDIKTYTTGEEARAAIARLQFQP